MTAPGGEPQPEEKPQPAVDYAKVDEHQIMISGLESCILQTQRSSVRFSGETAVFQRPDF